MATTIDTTRLDKLMEQIVNDDPGIDQYFIREQAAQSESPIEELFAAAYLSLILEGLQFERALRWAKSPNLARFLADEFKTVPVGPFHVYRTDIVIPQHEVEGVRVDFAMVRFEVDEDRNPTALIRSPLVVVECDGHQFHERTPAQAERDRSRDRAFQAAGHVVFRFTGRELWRDPIACAEQVEDFFNSLWLRRRT